MARQYDDYDARITPLENQLDKYRELVQEIVAALNLPEDQISDHELVELIGHTINRAGLR